MAKYRVRADGYAVGYADRHNGHAQYAHLEILTNMPVIAKQLLTYQCGRDHEPSEVRGGNASREGGKWPDSLDKIILKLIIMQAPRDAENDALVVKALPVSTLARRPGGPKRTKNKTKDPPQAKDGRLMHKRLSEKTPPPAQDGPTSRGTAFSSGRAHLRSRATASSSGRAHIRSRR